MYTSVCTHQVPIFEYIIRFIKAEWLKNDQQKGTEKRFQNCQPWQLKQFNATYTYGIEVKLRESTKTRKTTSMTNYWLNLIIKGGAKLSQRSSSRIPFITIESIDRHNYFSTHSDTIVSKAGMNEAVNCCLPLFILQSQIGKYSWFETVRYDKYSNRKKIELHMICMNYSIHQ